jgi:hypothetical protein
MLTCLNKSKPKLTYDQETALIGILEFIQTPINTYTDCSVILYAAAGCGKTFLTRHIADVLRGSCMIAGVAPTHKARKVLDKFLNNNTFVNIKTMTVASLLNKLRDHTYIGTKSFSGSGSKLDKYDIFIIDEASMITDEDIKRIITYAYQHKRKIIFVGDKYQIPNPTQKYEFENGMAYKADSCVFNIPGFELTTNLRQRDNNPIIPIYLEFRSAIQERREANINRETNTIKNSNGLQGVVYFQDQDEWYNELHKCIKNSVELNGFKDLHTIRVIAYTNDAIKSHNQNIRKMLNRGFAPEVGDLLMGYNNVGFPEPYVSNGQDYYIISVKPTYNHYVSSYSNLTGLIIRTKECDTNIQAELFIPDTGNPNNQAMLQDLVKRAEKVNSARSTKNDFRKYCDLRNKLIFMENLYKVQNEIIGESQFRHTHPLLYRYVNEVIDYDDHVILNNKLSHDIQEKYGNILQDRLNDNKMYTSIEKLCDKMCIIEKDIDYGFSLTSHKSQGSTYKTVFIDEYDFEKLKDSYNYRLGCEIKATKEKNQLKYVAYTRPTDTAYVFYRDVM